jgi:PAS domain S-box-containing protein
MATLRQPQPPSPAPAPRGGGSYDVLLEHSPDALLVIEQGRRSFRVVNAAAERLLSFTRDELLRLGPDDVSDPAEAPRLAEVRAHIVSFGWWHGEWGLRRKDGSVVHTEATVARVVTGGRVLFQGLFRGGTDLLDEGWLTDAVSKAHEMQHELNNNLALATGYAELLADNPRLPTDLQDAAREALVGGLGAVEAAKRLILCFTHRPDHGSTGVPVGKEKENVLPLPTALSAHRRPP